MEATPFLQLIIALGVIIVAAKLGGYASYSLGQPSVLGELLVGIIIGPSLLNLLHLPYFSDEHLVETVAHLGEIGVLLLMFIAGLELHLDELAKTGKVAVFAGILGVVVPLVLGTGLGLLFEFDIAPAVLVGLVLSATSVSISAQTLMELKVLRSRVGIGMMGSAVFDDILVILGLSLLFAVTHSGGNASIFGILWIALRMVLYLVGAWLVGAWLLPKLGAWVEKLPISMGLISFAFVIMLVYAWAAET
ncbi:MAG TPA: cation:proton antiporter, partial [Anaerolineales bacterium]